MRSAVASLTLLALVATQSAAQTAGGMSSMGGMDHMGGMQHGGASMSMPAPAGQAAFAAISDIVKQLQADSTTDWSKVNLEALRQHLIDMDNVTMRSMVKQSRTAGGLVMTITGTPTVAASIQRMVGMHAMMMAEGEPGSEADAMNAKAEKVPGGMRLTVTARDSSDTKLVSRIRGLGFIGLLTVGEHHAMHHMMVARGGMMMGH